jgi:hypothetical protein
VRSVSRSRPPTTTSRTPENGELLPLVVRRPRTALTILKFGAVTIAPALMAFRRGDDDAAMQRFAYGVLGKHTYDRLPEERKQQARENLNALGRSCSAPASRR